MKLYEILATILTLAALLGYFNSRYLKLPTTIAIMSGSLILSLVLLTAGQFGLQEFELYIESLLKGIDFHTLLMRGMLGYLLFAGALNVDINHLREYKWEIGLLATVSTVSSTFLIGIISYYLLPYAGFHLPFIFCLLFGSLISPTDPIAALAIFIK